MISKDDTISRAQSGDEGAFVDLMRAHYAFVYAVVIGIVDNPQDAEEIVQDTFLNAYRGLPDLEDTKKFKNWLAKIARNRALNWLREQRLLTVSINEVSEHALPPSDAPDEQLIHREQRELIRRVIETLSPKEREVARSYYLEGSSYDELTRTHGLSYKAISVRLSRAKQKLAKRLGHLLTGVFVSPITSLKQIYSGDVMKVGTVPKITAGAVAIIALVFIGTRQFISSKEDSSPSVEIVTSTPSESANSPAKPDAMLKGAVTAPVPEDKPQISAEEMEQIEDFFAQLDESDTQADTTQPLTDTEVVQDADEGDATDTSVAFGSAEQSAEDVMTAFARAFKNLDFEAMRPILTGTAKEHFESMARNSPIQIKIGEVRNEASDGTPDEIVEEMAEEVTRRLEQQLFEPMLKMYSQAEIVNSEYVGDEFHFRVKMPALEIPEMPGVEFDPELPPPPDLLFKMQKAEGAWMIYERANEMVYY